MKHLIKYNEKLTTREQYEKVAEITELTESVKKYATFVFADFLDDVAEISDPFITRYIPCGKFEIDIWIKSPDGCEMSDYIKYADNLKETLLDIESCLNKMKDEYEVYLVTNVSLINDKININFVIQKFEW